MATINHLQTIKRERPAVRAVAPSSRPCPFDSFHSTIVTRAPFCKISSPNHAVDVAAVVTFFFYTQLSPLDFQQGYSGASRGRFGCVLSHRRCVSNLYEYTLSDVRGETKSSRQRSAATVGSNAHTSRRRLCASKTARYDQGSRYKQFIGHEHDVSAWTASTTSTCIVTAHTSC